MGVHQEAGQQVPSKGLLSTGLGISQRAIRNLEEYGNSKADSRGRGLFIDIWSVSQRRVHMSLLVLTLRSQAQPRPMKAADSIRLFEDKESNGKTRQQNMSYRL